VYVKVHQSVKTYRKHKTGKKIMPGKHCWNRNVYSKWQKYKWFCRETLLGRPCRTGGTAAKKALTLTVNSWHHRTAGVSAAECSPTGCKCFIIMLF